MNDRILSVPGTNRMHGGSSGNDNDDRFVDDPLIPVFCREGQDDYFSLGFVVNWPATSTIESQAYNITNYEDFLSAVKTECFRGRDDFLFFLPFHALHITIATLFPVIKIPHLLCRNGERIAGSTMEQDKSIHEMESSIGITEHKWSALVDDWKQVLLRASSSDDWPTRPLELELESAEIRNRAGILLWKEHTGGIAKMRHCLEVVAREAEESLSALALEHLRIPDIIHTTFVRYHHCEVMKENCKTKNDDDNELVLLPSQAHSVLIERVLPNQALFSKTGSAEVDTGTDNHPPGRNGRNGKTGTKSERLVVDAANMVNCKMYLLDPRKEERHEVFLSLPLKEC